MTETLQIMRFIITIIAGLMSILVSPGVHADDIERKPLPLADPYVLCDGGLYYMYGTCAENGIVVFTSKDLKCWESPDGSEFHLALKKGDVWGEKWFWAPEVYKVGDTYIMYYTAEEHICAAEGDSPLGPFVQKVKTPMRPQEKGLDNSLFIDDNGRAYVFWSRFLDGLQIWMAELENDLVTMRPGTERPCIKMSQDWEKVWPSVNEGACVVKHNGTYYLTYSANSYESHNYGIGVAMTTDLSKPWVKCEDNPALQFPADLVGVGHHTFFIDNKGKTRIAYHCHFSKDSVEPRLVKISKYKFKRDHGKSDRLVISDRFTTPYYVTEQLTTPGN